MTRGSIWDVDRDRYAEPPLRIIPRGVCDLCFRFDYCPLHLPMPCYWCNVGTFIERGDDRWMFRWCPTCDGRDPFCEACRGKRIVAIRR
jgi:hypothetical protein